MLLKDAYHGLDSCQRFVPFQKIAVRLDDITVEGARRDLDGGGVCLWFGADGLIRGWFHDGRHLDDSRCGGKLARSFGDGVHEGVVVPDPYGGQSRRG